MLTDNLQRALDAIPEACLLERYNNLYPDQLHRDYLRSRHLRVLQDGSTVPERRGRPKGQPEAQRPRCCSRCGQAGHYAKTCGKRKG